MCSHYDHAWRRTPTASFLGMAIYQVKRNRGSVSAFDHDVLLHFSSQGRTTGNAPRRPQMWESERGKQGQATHVKQKHSSCPSVLYSPYTLTSSVPIRKVSAK